MATLFVIVISKQNCVEGCHFTTDMTWDKVASHPCFLLVFVGEGWAKVVLQIVAGEGCYKKTVKKHQKHQVLYRPQSLHHNFWHEVDGSGCLGLQGRWDLMCKRRE